MTLHHQRRRRRRRRRRHRRRRFGFYGLDVAARWAVLVICKRIEPRERRRCAVAQNRRGKWLIRQRTSLSVPLLA